MPSSRLITLLCTAAIALTCTACTAAPPLSSHSSQPDVSIPDHTASSAPAVSASVPEPPTPEEPSLPVMAPDKDVPREPAAPTPEPEPQPAPVPEPPQTPSAEQPQAPPPASDPTPPTARSTYDFSQPVPEGEPVESDYFADAAFVGDSRSEGFYLYGVKRGKNLSASGLSVFTFAQKKMLKIGGTYYTASDALSLKEYSKVYLGFGVNELGYINTDSFYEHYCSTIDAVRASQPKAVIYAQTMAPVNEGLVAATGGKKHLNNDRVRLYNDLIRKAAQEKQVPLLDVYSALEKDGALPTDASRDGIHLNREYCQKQLDYIRRHTVDFDTLYLIPDSDPEVTPDETSQAPADSSADPAPDGLLPQPEEPVISTESVSAEFPTDV